MKKPLMTYTLAAAVVLYAGAARGQQPEGHTMPGMAAAGQGADPAQLAACVQSQRDAAMLIEVAEARLEVARQSNEAAAMRAAIDDLQATLSRVRSRLTSCAQLSAAAPAADPHAGHVMAPTPPIDHSKMQMGTSPAAKPSSPTGAKPAAPAAPMDHSKMAMGAPADPTATATDPVCGLKVDPTSAPKATHQGETYYFCSERHQQLFTKTPAKYLPKRK